MSVPSRWLAALLLSAAGGIGQAQVVETEFLGRQLHDQQQARALARELSDEVLAISLRQLEENGLADLDVSQDIRSLRNALLAVVDEEIAAVIELLAAARTQPPDQSEATLAAARQRIRDIVRTLSAERLTVLRRMKVAELAGQTQKLIQMQSAVQTATAGLSQEMKPRQAALAAKVLEDQRDVRQAFLLLADMMTDVRTWGGAASSSAADGLKLATDREIGQQLDRAVAAIGDSRFDTATESQESALRDLRELLALLLQAQGLGSNEMPSIGNKVQELIARQETIRSETRELDPNVSPAESLVERQIEIKRELANLKNRLDGRAEARVQLEQASMAATEAAAQLFENQQEPAIAAQSQVLEHLAALEPLLKKPASPVRDRSAAELAREAQELANARQQLAEARKHFDSAVREAAVNVNAAAPLLASGAAAAKQAKRTPGLNETIKNRLEEAAETLQSTAERLSQPNGPMPAAPQQLLDDSETVLTRAMAAVDAALRDAQRKRSAVAIGEWARAAEVLERAAAEEREVARGSESASEASEGEPSVATRQENIGEVAEKIAEGLAETSPDTAGQVAEGREAVQQAADLAMASTEQLRQNMEQTADRAQSAADKFSAATEQLRKEISATAGELSENNAAEAERLAAARAGIEQVLHQLNSSLAARIDRLETARREVRDTLKQQAEAREMQDSVAQQRANLAAQGAQTLATADAPLAAAALARAVDAGEAARQDLVRGDLSQAAQAQSASTEELNDAVEKIGQALDEISRQHGEQLGASATIAKRLSEQAAELDLGAFESLEAARSAAVAGREPQATPMQRLAAEERFRRHLRRAVENLSTKEDEVRRQLSVADNLADLIQEQQAAAAAMAHQRGAANAAATTSEGVETLAAAMDQFAESQIAIGEGAVELSGQSEVANQALRDALTLAMKFSQSMAAPEASEQAMSGDVDRTMPEKREPMAQTEIPKAPAHQRESAGTPPVHDPLGDAEDIVLPVNMKADLGTGFVPKSPDVTANMMIGSEMRAAMEAADLALGRDKSRGKQKNKTLAKRKSKNHSEEAAAEPDDTPQQDEVAGGVAQMSPNQGKTSTVDNAPVRPGALQRQKEGTKVSGNSSGPRGSETDVTGSRQSQELPWLVKLPSELRRSIRAGAQQRAPKAYETRLREYFESVE